MKTIDAAQGSQEWLDIRAKHFTASEAPAMMGLSKYKTRQQLLREKATGLTEEVDAAKQRLFDSGHEAEAIARPLAEAIIGEDLFPATGAAEIDGLPLLASFDGLTMDESTSWENKLASINVETMIDTGDLDGTYWPQVEQQMLVSGATRALFTACDGEQITAQLWYESKPARRAALIAGWKQFAEDLANYQHIEVAAAPVAAPVESLPVLDIQISGSIVASNFTQWREIVGRRIAEINTDLQTDQHFADAAEMVKFLDAGEKRIDLVKSQAQAQASDIDAVFRALDDIKKLMASKRLELDKLVTRRKDSIKVEIMQEGKAKLAEHIAALNKRIGEVMMPAVPADFVTATKNKRTIQSLRDSVDAELTRAKLAANEAADRITINLNQYAEIAAGYEFLFSDLSALVNQPAAAFEAIVLNRINKHAEEERKRMEAEREKIAAQERAKIEREQAEANRKAEIERIAAEREANAKAREAAMPKVTETIDHGDGIKTIVVAAPAPQEPLGDSRGTATPAVAVHDNGRYIRLGEINAMLGFTVSSEFLAGLGFVATQDKNARLYRECDFPLICRAIVEHVATVASVPVAMRRAAA